MNSLVNASFVFVFFQQEFIELLLCAKHCVGDTKMNDCPSPQQGSRLGVFGVGEDGETVLFIFIFTPPCIVAD